MYNNTYRRSSKTVCAEINVTEKYSAMKKRRKMSEKTCFLTACTFAAAAILTALVSACFHFSDFTSGLNGIGGIIAFYAVSAAKIAVLCFLTALTMFFAVVSVVFSIKSIVNNEGVVRIYSVMLTALSSAAAAFGGVAFVLILIFLNNYKI